MSREESKRLKDIEERLLAIREEKERILQGEIEKLQSTALISLTAQLSVHPAQKTYYNIPKMVCADIPVDLRVNGGIISDD